MTRLTNHLRSQIANDLVGTRFAAAESEATAWMARVAQAAYDRQYNGTIREMYRLPKGWLPENDGIHVQVGDDVTLLYFDGKRVRKQGDQTQMRFPHSDRGQCLLQLEPNDALSQDIWEAQATVQKLAGDRKDLRAKIWATLQSFTTVKKLLDAWPEIEPAVKKVLEAAGESHALLPALPIADLTKELGL